jgi:hypothetical protein
MTKSEEFMEMEARYGAHNYHPLPVVLAKGEGAFVWDCEGKRYFDLVRRSQRDGNTTYLAKKCANKDANLQSIIESKMKKMDAIYWPYNLDELKVNPYLIQNSAFGSGENSSYEAN